MPQLLPIAVSLAHNICQQIYKLLHWLRTVKSAMQPVKHVILGEDARIIRMLLIKTNIQLAYDNYKFHNSTITWYLVFDYAKVMRDKRFCKYEQKCYSEEEVNGPPINLIIALYKSPVFSITQIRMTILLINRAKNDSIYNQNLWIATFIAIRYSYFKSEEVVAAILDGIIPNLPVGIWWEIDISRFASTNVPICGIRTNCMRRTFVCAISALVLLSNA